MSRSISEPDWKVFRTLQPIALERFCQRVLSEIVTLASETNKTNHERYLAIYQMVKERDRQIADTFNDSRRSTAVQQLACIHANELLTEDEMSRFSPETRRALQSLLEIWRE